MREGVGPSLPASWTSDLTTNNSTASASSCSLSSQSSNITNVSSSTNRNFDSSSSKHTKDESPVEEDWELREFNNFFERILSTDSQKRKEAEDELKLIPPLSTCSFLLKGYEKTKIDEYRQFALNSLCTHLEKHWREIFPTSQSYENRDAFCHELLGLVQTETNAVFRQTLAYLVALTARKRLIDTGGVQDWEELMEYIELSPKSSSDVHMRIALAIVIELPTVFGDQSDTCDSFFRECAWSDFISAQSEIIRAFLAVCSSGKDAVAGHYSFSMSHMIHQYHHKKKKETDDNDARNDLAETLLLICLGSTIVRCQIVGLNVLKYFPQSLDRQCLPLVKNLIENCLTSSHPSARSTALDAYSKIIVEGDNYQSPLADLIPFVLSMCEEDPIVEEERQQMEEGEEEDRKNDFTPLNCLDRIAEGSSSLLQPHLHTILPLCREILEFSSTHPSDVTEREVCLSILHGLLSNYWERISAIFGQGCMADLFEFVTTIANKKEQSRKLIKLLIVFSSHDETADQSARLLPTVLSGIVATCQDVNSTSAEKTACLLSLRAVAIRSPNLLRPILSSLISLCCQMNNQANMDYQWISSDIITTLCEKSSEMIKTVAADSIPTLLESTLRKAANYDDNYFLATEPEELEEDEGISSTEVIDQVINPLGAHCAVHNLSMIADKYAKDGDSRHRYMAVLARAAISLRLNPLGIATFKNDLASFLEDTDPQVRGIACHSLQQVAERGAQYAEKLPIEKIVPLLVPLYKTTVLPRLASTAGWTLASFISAAPTNCTANFELILNESIALLETESMDWLTGHKQFLLDSTLASIRALSTKGNLAIVIHYDRLILPLRAILRERPPREVLLTIVRCISVIGKSAGQAKFHADGLEILGSVCLEIPSLLTGKTFAADFSRMISVIGVDSARFLPAIVPKLIEGYKELDQLHDSSDYAWRHYAPKKREAAKHILNNLRNYLGDAFSPYAEDMKALGI